MRGIVISVNLNKERGQIKLVQDEITLKDNYGVIGDGHAGIDHKQVSLVGVESYIKMSKEDNKYYPYGSFAENITTKGIVLYDLKVGNKIQIGDVLLEVSQIGKTIHPTNFKTMLPKEGIFAVVLKGGKITKGDSLLLLKE
jgi:MOSC domain-containing protein YiiM